MSLLIHALLQVPKNVPVEPEPVGITEDPTKILLYFVLPAVLVLIYYFGRKRRKKKNK